MRAARDLRTWRVSLAAILTQRLRHGLAEKASGAVGRRGRRPRRHELVGQWRSREPGEPREDPSLRLTLEIPTTSHRAIVLPDGLIQDDSCPVARCELGLADVGDRAGFRAADPYPVPYFKAVCVLGQYDASI